MRNIKIIIGVIFLFFVLSLTSCSKDKRENYSPITYCFEFNEKYQIETVRLSEQNDEVTLLIKGGDGSFRFSNQNNAVVAFKYDGLSGLKLTALSVGESVITISDNSGNTALLPVKVAVQEISLEFKPRTCLIYGDELTENEVADLKRDMLYVTSLQFDFKFSFYESNKGFANVYPKDVDGIESKKYTFEFDEVVSSSESFYPIKINTQFNGSFLLTSDEEVLLLLAHRYLNESDIAPGSRTKSVLPRFGFTLDVTNRYKVRYPKLERAYIVM